ncbi:PaaX family transcriptional regulator [Sinomonas cyclohexanicum]|uniref:PaaX family transcriptional regulator n=1 Tax=Sinomonas cyclohexanicum TaxID=322009 RepID=A0ABM7PQC1_SINCY|nr:PaaX family transcriptional regulator C-terminal domain-containing protein [Corynebacterium cyclohexanicum]BCT74367.1 PaaX family transcriptional regulator [Corynebacterium cyclohexanicum]
MPPRTNPLLQELVVTLYGLYADGELGELPIAGLIRLLAGLGVEEQAARATVSRLKGKGILRHRREGSTSLYSLNPGILDLFRADDERIFAPLRSTPQDPWALIVFSVPEAQRNRRYELRTELVSLGFGFVAAGVAIAPRTVLDQARERLEARGLDGFTECFAGDYLTGADIRAKVAAWWDLAGLDEQYAAFIADYETIEGPSPDGAEADQAAFAVYVPMLTRWRRFPYRDPNLPLEFLPEGWPAPSAKAAFLRLHAELAGPAAEHARRALA